MQQLAARAINATPILNREKRIRLQALLIYKHTFTSCWDISACAYIRNSTVLSQLLSAIQELIPGGEGQKCDNSRRLVTPIFGNENLISFVNRILNQSIR